MHTRALAGNTLTPTTFCLGGDCGRKTWLVTRITLDIVGIVLLLLVLMAGIGFVLEFFDATQLLGECAVRVDRRECTGECAIRERVCVLCCPLAFAAIRQSDCLTD